MSDLKAIDELDEQLWKLQNATLHDGADANHRRQQINRNTAKAALLKWRDRTVVAELKQARLWFNENTNHLAAKQIDNRIKELGAE